MTKLCTVFLSFLQQMTKVMYCIFKISTYKHNGFSTKEEPGGMFHTEYIVLPDKSASFWRLVNGEQEKVAEYNSGQGYEG